MKPKTMLSLHNPLVSEFKPYLMQHSKNDVLLWCTEIITSMLIPCLERHDVDITISIETLNLVDQWMKKEIKLTQVKPMILKLHKQAHNHEDNLVVLGCLRAIAHGCSTIHSQAHAMGVIYYGVLALAREQCQDESKLCLEEQCSRLIIEMKDMFEFHMKG
jgi:hypothetical protein